MFTRYDLKVNVYGSDFMIHCKRAKVTESTKEPKCLEQTFAYLWFILGERPNAYDMGKDDHKAAKSSQILKEADIYKTCVLKKHSSQNWTCFLYPPQMLRTKHACSIRYFSKRVWVWMYAVMRVRQLKIERVCKRHCSTLYDKLNFFYNLQAF